MVETSYDDPTAVARFSHAENFTESLRPSSVRLTRLGKTRADQIACSSVFEPWLLRLLSPRYSILQFNALEYRRPPITQMPFEFPTVEVLVVTFVVTAIRTILEASPTILGGVIVAAYLRTQVEPERLKTLFRGEGIEGVLRAALMGIAMPVCSIGVLPVLRELRLLGLPTSKLITLGLVAPLLNPFSMLYGLSVLSATECLMIVAVTGIAAIAVGDVSARFAVRESVDAVARPAGLTGGTRLWNLLIASSRLVTGRTLVDLMLTIAVAAFTAALIRDGAFYLVCDPANRAGPAMASLLTLPQYVSPSRGIIQFAGIGNANLSLPTGLVIYVFGTSIGAATILAYAQCYGLRRLSALTLALCLIVGTVSYSSGYLLPAQLGELAETSALDGLTRPVTTSLPQIVTSVEESLAFVDPLMLLSAVAVLVLFVAGLIVRAKGIGFRDDDPETASQQNASRMSKAVPASQIGAVAVCGFGVLFCLSTYMLFPSPSEFLDEMEMIQLDASIAIRRGNIDEAVDRIAAWDSAAAKLPIGAAIRGSLPSQSQRKVTRDMRAALNRTRALLREGDLNSAKETYAVLMELLSETKNSFAQSF